MKEAGQTVEKRARKHILNQAAMGWSTSRRLVRMYPGTVGDDESPVMGYEARGNR